MDSVNTVIRYPYSTILSQHSVNNQLHPIAFYSQKFVAIGINYDVYDKELLAIITALEEWPHHLVGTQPIIRTSSIL